MRKERDLLTCGRETSNERPGAFSAVDISESVDDVVGSFWRRLCELNSRLDDICRETQHNSAPSLRNEGDVDI